MFFGIFSMLQKTELLFSYKLPICFLNNDELSNILQALQGGEIQLEPSQLQVRVLQRPNSQSLTGGIRLTMGWCCRTGTSGSIAMGRYDNPMPSQPCPPVRDYEFGYRTVSLEVICPSHHFMTAIRIEIRTGSKCRHFLFFQTKYNHYVRYFLSSSSCSSIREIIISRNFFPPLPIRPIFVLY